MKTILTTFGMVIVATAACAQTTLWKTDTATHKYYRIPAIVAYDNHVIAFSDNRSGVTDATSWGDVGSVGNISIEVRHSNDGGRPGPLPAAPSWDLAAATSTRVMAMPPWCATARRAACSL